MADKAAQYEWVQRVLGVEIAAEEPCGTLDAEAYQQYLRQGTQRLKTSGSAEFALALSRGPDQHRMALHPKRSPQALSARLIQDTGLNTVTWGTARPSTARPGTMELALEGRQLPGMRKKTEQMLRAFRPLPFVKVMLTVDDSEVGDLPDPDDIVDNRSARLPVSVLPEPGEGGTVQSLALTQAAASGAAFCEECAEPPAETEQTADMTSDD